MVCERRGPRSWGGLGRFEPSRSVPRFSVIPVRLSHEQELKNVLYIFLAGHLSDVFAFLISCFLRGGLCARHLRNVPSAQGHQP